jgi:acyl carrier protein
MEQKADNAKIFGQIKEAICKVQPGIDEKKIKPEAKLKDDLEIDSLSMVELALAMEDACGFLLPDEELEQISTVGDAVSLIESKVKAQNA